MTKISNRDRILSATTSENVYRLGTQSGETWAMILNEPGKSFHEYVASGARANTIADALRKGYLVYGKTVSEPVKKEKAKKATVKRLAKELAALQTEESAATFATELQNAEATQAELAKDNFQILMIKCRDGDAFCAKSELQDHALDNYETNGWDMIYECYGHEEVAEEIKGKRFATRSAFFKHFERIGKLYNEQRKAAQNEAF